MRATAEARRKRTARLRSTASNPANPEIQRAAPSLGRILRTLVAEAIYETITVQTKNGSRKMTALAALIRKNLHLGLAGDRKGMQNTLDLMRASNLLEAEKAVDPAKNELSADDAAVLQEYLNRHTRKDDE